MDILRQPNHISTAATVLLENDRQRQRLLQAMEDVMPLVASSAEDCALYQLAKTTCSEYVWLSEADPVRFLQYCRGNPWEASKRMLEYWKLRHEIFGPDRFWKPVLDTSGTQALSNVAAKQVHISYLLPPDGTHGRTVLFHCISTETEKIYSEMLPSERNETMFYALQLAVWGSSCRSNTNSPFPVVGASTPVAAAAVRANQGFRFVQVRLGSGFKTFPELQRIFARAMQSCFPIACQGIHIVCAPKLRPGLQLRFANQILPFVWKLMESLFANLAERRTLDFVAWSDDLDRNKKLEDLLITKLGLDPRGLPPVAGGVWDHTSFAQSKWATHFNDGSSTMMVASSSPFLPFPHAATQYTPDSTTTKEMTSSLLPSTVVHSDPIHSLDLLASMSLFLQLRSAATTEGKRGTSTTTTTTTIFNNNNNNDMEPPPTAKRSRFK
jgi:hypothetical protein